MQSPNGRTSDFTAIADRYDATRHVPERVLTQCYDMLIERMVLPRDGAILDAGCGTGQMSIPLARRGFDIVGIDVSDAMVRIAAAKVEDGWRARYEVGDARSIGYGDGTFDGVVLSKLLMHIEDWREVCRELVRVTTPGSCIVQIMDRGFFGNAVRREFSRRADDAGVKGRFLGAISSSGEIPGHMASLGCTIDTLTSERLVWDHSVTRREALDGFRDRLFAEFWYLPIPLYDRILDETFAWALGQPGGLDEPEHLAPNLFVEIYRTPTLGSGSTAKTIAG